MILEGDFDKPMFLKLAKTIWLNKAANTQQSFSVFTQ